MNLHKIPNSSSVNWEILIISQKRVALFDLRQHDKS